MSAPHPVSWAGRVAASACLGLALMATPPAARGAGPLTLCDSGVPFLWPGGGMAIPFNPDQGPLGPLPHDDAVAFVQSAFFVWEDVPESTVSFQNAGELPVDVNVTNFIPYLFPESPDGLNAIVFDDTGEIFDILFGPDSGILGFAGPEWLDDFSCEIVEGVCFLNGPSFIDFEAAFDAMVHEFGHFIGLAHSVVNGQIYIGDTTGPTPHDAFGPAPDPFAEDVIETMYPFYFGPGSRTATLEKDDVAGLIALYPAPGAERGFATIKGKILGSDGITRVSGANVIARNLADPFKDAVSAISGDYSFPMNPGDTMGGIFMLKGLTPDAEYVLYVDQILAGGFSTEPTLIPGPEEFFNGPRESNNRDDLDDPLDFEPLSVPAGEVAGPANIILNAYPVGIPLPLGDDGSLDLLLPFPITICGEPYSRLSINANGNLTFGFAEGSPFPSPRAFLTGPPRIAALWTDLNPAAGGEVRIEETPDTFSVIWDRVPEFPASGANSFTITLHRAGNRISVEYGEVSARSGIAGLSAGFLIANGSESPTDLTIAAIRNSRFSLWPQPAVFEEFHDNFDLAGLTVQYQHNIRYSERWAGDNDSLAAATPITLPFDSSPIRHYTDIAPIGRDVDFFRFFAPAGLFINAEITAGAFDTILGLYSPSGELIALDDDGGEGLLSHILHRAPVDGEYTIAVSAYPDLAFNGMGSSGGRYVLKVNTVVCGSNDPPGPANWLVNGGFETGDLAGWTAFATDSSSPDWAVGNDRDSGFFAPLEPQEGCFLASSSFDGCGPLQSGLYQDVVLPPGLGAATLAWSERLRWDLANFGAFLDRQYRVEIIDAESGELLEVVHAVTLPAGVTADLGWQSHSVDLSAYSGRAIRILFVHDIPECFSGPGQFELDAVRLFSE